MSMNCLRVAVHQREPRALHLHHDAVPAAEDVWQTSGMAYSTLAALPGSNGSGFSKLLRNLPRITSPRTSC